MNKITKRIIVKPQDPQNCCLFDSCSFSNQQQLLLLIYYIKLIILCQKVSDLHNKVGDKFFDILCYLMLNSFYGVDVSEQNVVELTEKLLKQYSSKYNKENFHFLTYALQHRLKILSKQAIRKGERKNKRRMLQSQNSKSKIICFKMKSPQQIALKCARRAALALIFKTEIQKCQKIPPMLSNSHVVKRPVVSSRRATRQRHGKTKPTPNRPLVTSQELIKKGMKPYFAKKKANQKRRRLEKHILIKENKKALAALFGSVIYSSQWKISREEIRKALSMKNPSLKPMDVEVGNMFNL